MEVKIPEFTNSTRITAKTKIYHEHIFLGNSMYVSDAFFNILKDKVLGVRFKDHLCYCNIYIKAVHPIYIRGRMFQHMIYGISGSQMTHTSDRKFKLHQGVVNKMHKLIIKEYFLSNLCRLLKIKKLMGAYNSK